ncbi:hypothetical protein T4E_6345 [Trichinella pseudospiralis]|uniref:Uncharacterized protein n=1 Tax=Trichinella pseudospiralis TaxID=6337 RepID=A0A0V0XG96_TRIPS|nr:hypothetical protein T4E_6345 [Trichinella pseudospiralis]
MHFPLPSSAGMLPDKIHPNDELTASGKALPPTILSLNSKRTSISVRSLGKMSASFSPCRCSQFAADGFASTVVILGTQSASMG